MRIALRALLVAAAAMSVTVGLLPAAQAADPPVFTVQDSTAYEYYWSCSSSAPYTCSSTGLSLYIPISMNYPSSTPVTLGYQIVDITTTAGQDYTGPTSGTFTLPSWQAGTTLAIPLVNDGVSEPDETFQVRLTSSSIGAVISDTGIGTIRDASQFPSDCVLSRGDAYTASVSCTNRPATQQWYHQIVCQSWGATTVNGNVVTGNGTSTARCSTWQTYRSSTFQTLS